MMHIRSEIPPLMRLQSGAVVQHAGDWQARRGEILQIALTLVYGALPALPRQLECVVLHEATVARLQNARKLSLRLLADGLPVCHLSVLLPPGPGPFASLLHGDACWSYATDAVQAEVLARGYALAEFNRAEVMSDRADGALPPIACSALHGTHVQAIAAWAWGYHRAVDGLLQLPELDGARIAVVGHSRGGKAALLAGATDTRIALTSANNSGLAGAGSFHRPGPGAETLEDMFKAFPHWLSPAMQPYCGRENDLPWDQHFLMALIAPRALLCTEATGDLWANPGGTQQMHEAAAAVYRWMGAESRMAIHFRQGGHSHTLPDWATLLDFMDATFSA